MFFTGLLVIWCIICKKTFFQGESIQNALIKLGFWPGGDRDGNPFVTTEITLRLQSVLELNFEVLLY
jgi:phosphoenolpyruvate carboxylase